MPCKTILFEYFNTTYPKAAEAAAMHRAAAVTAGRTSPDSVMDSHATLATSPSPPTKPMAEEPDVSMEDAGNPEYSFYPVPVR